MLHKNEATEVWTFYFGPQGVSVNPCAIGPFEKMISVAGISPPQIGDGNIALPPHFPGGKWTELHGFSGEDDCLIIADGSMPPTLMCGQDPVFSRIVDFEIDPKYKEPPRICDNGLKYQRGYFVEY